MVPKKSFGDQTALDSEEEEGNAFIDDGDDDMDLLKSYRVAKKTRSAVSKVGPSIVLVLRPRDSKISYSSTSAPNKKRKKKRRESNSLKSASLSMKKLSLDELFASDSSVKSSVSSSDKEFDEDIEEQVHLPKPDQLTDRSVVETFQQRSIFCSQVREIAGFSVSNNELANKIKDDYLNSNNLDIIDKSLWIILMNSKPTMSSINSILHIIVRIKVSNIRQLFYLSHLSLFIASN